MSLSPPPPTSALDTKELLAQAFNHHRGGQTADAARLYSAILAVDPGHVDALHLLGTLKGQSGELAEGLRLIAAALERKKDSALIWFNHGNALKELGRHAEAIESYDQALALEPRLAVAASKRGDSLSELGRHAEALDSFDKALAVDPRLVDAINNRGNELRALGRHAEALESYARVLAMAPDHAAAQINRANTLFELKRVREALAGYESALAVMPDSYNLLVRTGDTLQLLDRYADALAMHDRALAVAPELVQAHNGRASALKRLGRLEEAEASARRALELDATYAEAHGTLGDILRELGRLDEAVAILRHALDLKPTLAEVRFNLAIALLLRGDFRKAWPEYEARWQLAHLMRWGRSVSMERPDVDAPEWSGEPLAGKRLLLYAEQGLGDTIHFARFLPILQEKGAIPTLLAPARLKRLLSTLSGSAEIASVITTERFDFRCALLSLPLKLGIDAGSIPSHVPYLAAEPDRVAKWRDVLGSTGFRIGIAWQGTPKVRIDAGRSFPVRALAPLAGIPGVRLISLQKGPGSDQLDDLPDGMTVEKLNAGFDAGEDAFIDSAAVMANLDLIITSDTSIAHLAGALGRPVWVALRAIPDWRWMLGRTDSAWYPTMRLFRQPTRDDWGSVFAEMAEAMVRCR